MEIIWTDSAKISLLHIIRYVESLFGTKVAFETRTLILESAKKLASFPFIGSIQLTMSYNVEIRCLVVKKSKIFYYITDSGIVIFLVWDTRRNPDILNELLNKLK